MGNGGFAVYATFLYGIKERYISYIVDSDNKRKIWNSYIIQSKRYFQNHILNFDHDDNYYHILL